MTEKTHPPRAFANTGRPFRVGIAFLFCVPAFSAIAWLYCRALPHVYWSSAIVEIREMTWSGPSSLYPGPDRDQIHFLVQRQKSVLSTVIEQLRLVERWSSGGKMLSPEEAYEKLISELGYSYVWKTNLVQLWVPGPNPDQAAELANAIASEYERESKQEALEQWNKVVSGFRALDALRQEMLAGKENAEQIRNRDRVQDPAPDEPTAGKFGGDYAIAKLDYMERKKQFEVCRQGLESMEYQAKKTVGRVKVWEPAVPTEAHPVPDTAKIVRNTVLIALILFGLPGSTVLLSKRVRSPGPLQ